MRGIRIPSIPLRNLKWRLGSGNLPANQRMSGVESGAFRAQVEWWKTLVEMEIEWRRKEIYDLRARGWTRNASDDRNRRQNDENRLEPVTSLQVGSRVLAPFEGKMSLGVISAIELGGISYTISLDEGDDVVLPLGEFSIPSSIHMPRILQITLDFPKVSVVTQIFFRISDITIRLPGTFAASWSAIPHRGALGRPQHRTG
jgi:hypothetical protein